MSHRSAEGNASRKTRKLNSGKILAVTRMFSSNLQHLDKVGLIAGNKP